jgi:ribonucleoside-triphosphate reductase
MKIRSPRVFRLSERFLEPYKSKDVPWGPVGYVTYKRTYARRLDELNPDAGTEEWWQTCRRVIEGMFTMQKRHCVEAGLPWNDAKAQRTAKTAYERLFELKWTPPGRGLWMMGTDFVENRTGAGLFNCAFRSTKDVATKGGYLFQWMMDALMVGIGVGFDTLGAGTLEILDPGSKYPTPEPIAEAANKYMRINGEWTCVIADSREGWVESVRVLLNAFYFGYELPAFCYDEIRPAGSPIKGFGGIASGPGPLAELHEYLIRMYNQCIGQMITTDNIVDTQNLIGRCVVAGNVRRSAALAMGTAGDRVFMKLKDPTEIHEWEAELAVLSEKFPIPNVIEPEELTKYVGVPFDEFSEPISDEMLAAYNRQEELKHLIANHPLRHHRWGSNNSVDVSGVTDFHEYADLTVKNGEPGYIFLENARTHGRFKDPVRLDDVLVMGFNPCVEQQLEDGELCCLVETYPWLHESYEDYLITLKIAYLYAKTVTLAKTQWPETNAIMLKNRRIGLSMSGFIQSCYQRSFTEMYQWCDQAYEYVKNLDGIYSDWLCVPRSKRMTSIKPSGTVSKLNGSWPGIHHPEAEFYFQRIRFAADNDMLPALQAAGYPVEDCVYSPNTKVVTFPVREQHFVRGKKEVSMWEQLEIAAQMQHYWADNSVSVTVTFQEHEAASIPHALQLYSTRLKAVSFLKYKETGYVQAPYEPCTREQYEQLVSQVTPIQRIDTHSQGIGERFCTNDSCEINWGEA